MMRQTAPFALAAAAFGAALFTTAPSHAQDYYAAGKVSVAIERAFGLHYWHEEYTRNNLTDTHSGTAVGFAWLPSSSPFHVPRAAVDGFIINRLSLGGSLGFFSESGTNTPDRSGVIFSPRVGYVIPISSIFSFWPRDGFTFIKPDNGSLFGLTAEAMFVVTPRPGWGILFGPTLDFGFAGSRDPNGTNWNHFALGFPTVGLMGTF
jgi:hypothetical protein